MREETRKRCVLKIRIFHRSFRFIIFLISLLISSDNGGFITETIIGTIETIPLEAIFIIRVQVFDQIQGCGRVISPDFTGLSIFIVFVNENNE